MECDQVTYCVEVKNEYLALTENGKVVARNPDIISLDDDNMNIVQSDRLNNGTRVYVVTCRGPEVWYTE